MASQRRGRGRRSPSFPFIALHVALQRAKTFHAQERRNAAPLEVAARHWGYSPKSSGASQTMAALRAFGLLDGEGTVRLSDAALRILLDERDPSPERETLLRAAALHPPLHKKLWEHYRGSLPSDATLRLHLLTEQGFNENSVDEFIAEFRATLDFAGFRAVAEDLEVGTVPEASRQPDFGAEVAPMVFPLRNGNVVEFRIRQRISGQEADDLRQLFELWLSKITQP